MFCRTTLDLYEAAKYSRSARAFQNCGVVRESRRHRGFLVWFSFCSLWMEYAYTRPTSMLPTLGRQDELDTHGHVVYLTHNEVLILHTLGESGMGFMIVAALVGLAAKHRLRRRD